MAITASLPDPSIQPDLIIPADYQDHLQLVQIDVYFGLGKLVAHYRDGNEAFKAIDSETLSKLRDSASIAFTPLEYVSTIASIDPEAGVYPARRIKVCRDYMDKLDQILLGEGTVGSSD